MHGSRARKKILGRMCIKSDDDLLAGRWCHKQGGRMINGPTQGPLERKQSVLETCPVGGTGSHGSIRAHPRGFPFVQEDSGLSLASDRVQVTFAWLLSPFP